MEVQSQKLLPAVDAAEASGANQATNTHSQHSEQADLIEKVPSAGSTLDAEIESESKEPVVVKIETGTMNPRLLALAATAPVGSQQLGSEQSPLVVEGDNHRITSVNYATPEALMDSVAKMAAGDRRLHMQFSFTPNYSSTPVLMGLPLTARSDKKPRNVEPLHFLVGRRYGEAGNVTMQNHTFQFYPSLIQPLDKRGRATLIGSAKATHVLSKADCSNLDVKAEHSYLQFVVVGASTNLVVFGDTQGLNLTVLSSDRLLWDTEPSLIPVNAPILDRIKNFVAHVHNAAGAAGAASARRTSSRDSLSSNMLDPSETQVLEKKLAKQVDSNKTLQAENAKVTGKNLELKREIKVLKANVPSAKEQKAVLKEQFDDGYQAGMKAAKAEEDTRTAKREQVLAKETAQKQRLEAQEQDRQHQHQQQQRLQQQQQQAYQQPPLQTPFYGGPQQAYWQNEQFYAPAPQHHYVGQPPRSDDRRLSGGRGQGGGRGREFARGAPPPAPPKRYRDPDHDEQEHYGDDGGYN